ncbi:TPA: hypothetical protein ACSP7Z_004320 [Serratia fonticola]
MTTFLDELAAYGEPKQHRAIFKVSGVEYEVYFTQITDKNPFDCTAELHPRFIKPAYAKHYEIAFDAKQNRVNKTYFRRVIGLPQGSAIQVMNCVERIIFDHYTTFNVGLYTYAPNDFKLSSVYCRLISRPKHIGSSIEVGLEPMGRTHVLRTPYFYA